MLNKNRRILWLLNHKTLMPYEAKLLRELGYEIFTPKIIPNSPSFRSGAVSFEYDSTLTVPAGVLAKLNNFDFYETAWPTEIVILINRYFGSIYVIPHALQIREAVRSFEGQIMFRAFGLDNSQTYENVLRILYGSGILSDIAALGGRFWFAAGYSQLVECEPPMISEREIFLPIGVPSSFWETANSYTGVDKKILFVCPNCVTNPYYSAIYKKFKEDFGDLPHVIVGAQDVPVDDPCVLGFVSDKELIRLYKESAVLYYHSTELRHVHYAPIEAAINGMPVVYYAESLLGRMTPEISMGRCSTLCEARQCIERVLAGDAEFVDALRAQQRDLSFLFSDEYCKAVWQKNFQARGYEASLRPDTPVKTYWREAKRTLFRSFAHGMSVLPPNTHWRKAKRNVRETLAYCASIIATKASRQGNGMAALVSDASLFEGGINFSHTEYPSFVHSVTGISGAEPWGRWSDLPSVNIVFSKPLPRDFRLVIDGCAYGPNIGSPITVKIGSAKHRLTFHDIDGARERVAIDVSIRKPTNSIQIAVPRPIIPPNDNRRIGVGFWRLYIEDIPAGGV